MYRSVHGVRSAAGRQNHALVDEYAGHAVEGSSQVHASHALAVAWQGAAGSHAVDVAGRVGQDALDHGWTRFSEALVLEPLAHEGGTARHRGRRVAGARGPTVEGLSRRPEGVANTRSVVIALGHSRLDVGAGGDQLGLPAPVAAA